MDATLVIFKKNGRRKDILLKKGVNIVGRRSDCDVYIPHIYVSRKHCRIVRQDEKLVVQDLGSANGTFINNERIMEGVLQAGDVLSVGAFTFTVAIDGKPEQIKPPAQPQPEQVAAPAKKVKKTETSISAATGSASASAVALQEPTTEEDVEPIRDSLADLEPLAGDFDLDDSSTYKDAN